jgi:hypothetical protein
MTHTSFDRRCKAFRTHTQSTLNDANERHSTTSYYSRTRGGGPGACLTCCFLAEITSTNSPGLRLALYFVYVSISVLLVSLEMLKCYLKEKNEGHHRLYSCHRVLFVCLFLGFNSWTFQHSRLTTLSPNKTARNPRNWRCCHLLTTITTRTRIARKKPTSILERERERVPTTSPSQKLQNQKECILWSNCNK